MAVLYNVAITQLDPIATTAQKPRTLIDTKEKPA
jgi:hypothetical protein